MPAKEFLSTSPAVRSICVLSSARSPPGEGFRLQADGTVPVAQQGDQKRQAGKQEQGGQKPGNEGGIMEDGWIRWGWRRECRPFHLRSASGMLSSELSSGSA